MCFVYCCRVEPLPCPVLGALAPLAGACMNPARDLGRILYVYGIYICVYVYAYVYVYVYVPTRGHATTPFFFGFVCRRLRPPLRCLHEPGA